MDTGILISNESECLYSIVEQSAAKRKVEELPNGDIEFNVDLSNQVSFKTYFNSSTGKRVTRDAIFIKEYFVVEDRDSIHWKIGNAIKMIGGLKAKNAYGVYKGRNYTAWFAPTIPLPFGPWKLWGLPGLILEAVDETNEVKFILLDTKNLKQNQLATEKRFLSDRLEVLTWQQYTMKYREKASMLQKTMYTKAGGTEFDTKVTLKMNMIEKTIFE